MYFINVLYLIYKGLSHTFLEMCLRQFSVSDSNHFNGFKDNLDLSVVIQTSLYFQIPGKLLKQDLQKFKAIFAFMENLRPACLKKKETRKQHQPTSQPIKPQQRKCFVWSLDQQQLIFLGRYSRLQLKLTWYLNLEI